MTFDAETRQRLLTENAAGFAATAQETITRAYPAAVMYTARSDADLFTHRQAHPTFYGSFDWHSCVEMHWALYALISRFPELPLAPAYGVTLDELYAPENLAREVAFFDTQRTFERPYGWGWFLAHDHQLATADDADANRWAESMKPLADLFRKRLIEWLPNLTWPVRHGVHANTAFALARSLPYARLMTANGDGALEAAVLASARHWFLADRDYPVRYEPSGTDFLSPALTETELMAEVLDPDEFAAWLDGFLPGLAREEPASFFQPVAVTDASDGHLAHLHGLNLSRAWGWRRIAEALPAGDPRIAVVLATAGRHAVAGLPYVTSGDYMTEHWLAAYAVLMLKHETRREAIPPGAPAFQP